VNVLFKITLNANTNPSLYIIGILLFLGYYVAISGNFLGTTLPIPGA
jgi:hypothetical protein